MTSFRDDIPIQELSIVVPVYNDAAILEKALTTILEHLEESLIDWELVLVDDHSKDDSYDRMISMGLGDHPHVRLLRLTRNYGQHAAFLAGIDHANKKWCLTFDLDSAPAIKELDTLLSEIEGHKCDLLSVSRKGQRDVPFHRSWGSRCLNWLANLATSQSLEDPLSPLKLGHCSIGVQLPGHGEKRRFLAPLVIQLSTQPREISIQLPKRRGRTQFDVFDLFRLMFDFVLNFFPRLFSRIVVIGILIMGFVVATCGLYLLLRLLDVIAPSIHFQVVALVMLGICFNVLMLAIVGEYHIRMYELVQHREIYRIVGEDNEKHPTRNS